MTAYALLMDDDGGGWWQFAIQPRRQAIATIQRATVPMIAVDLVTGETVAMSMAEEARRAP